MNVRGTWRRRLGCLALVLGACSAASVEAQVTQVDIVPGDNSNSVASTQVPTMVPGTLSMVGPNPRAVAVSPDGRRLYVANYGGATGVTVYEAASFNYVTTISDAWSAHGLAIPPTAAGST